MFQICYMVLGIKEFEPIAIEKEIEISANFNTF